MCRSTALTAFFVVACLGARLLMGEAAETRGESARHANCCAPMPCCPDNYCKKPMPCIPCPKWCGSPDDYCKKPMPCIPCPNWCGCPDNYCKKPMPNLCLPRNWQFYRCPPCESPYYAQQKPPAEAKPAPKPLAEGK